MRRIDIINSALKLKNIFEEIPVARYFAGNSSAQTGIDPEKLMEDFQKFSIRYDKLNEFDKKILEIFGLEDLHTGKLWISLLTGPEKRGADPRTIHRRISYIAEFLPMLVALIRQDNLEYDLKDNTIEINANRANKSLITIVLPESENEHSTPQRLINTLQSIELFYKTISFLYDENENTLDVIATDSGSDKSFDFLGLAKVVTAIKELIILMWDRVVFYKELKMEARVDLVAKSLPVMEQISLLEKNGKIGKEQSQILKSNIFEGVNKFLTSGAIIPELEQHSTYNPREIMAPEQKLISMPEEKFINELDLSKINDKPIPKSIENPFTAEQMEQVLKILEENNKKVKKTTPKPSGNRGKAE